MKTSVVRCQLSVAEALQLRAPVARGMGASGAVDRQNKLIRGFSVITKGEATGHGLVIDDTTLAQVAAAGNAGAAGIKQRYSHPDLVRAGLGGYLGRATNFRVEGDRVLADAKLANSAFSSPAGDLGSYVLDLAEEDPESFGASIEPREWSLEPRFDAGGGRLKPALRVKSLKAVDFVDDPAANAGGLLSAAAFASADNSSLEVFLSTHGAITMPTADELAAQKAADEKKKADELALAAKKEEEAASAKKAADERLALAAKEAADKARDDERKSIREVMALCNKAGCPEKADEFVDQKLSLSEVKDRLLSHLIAHGKPSGDAGGGSGAGGDPLAKAKAEYKAQESVLLSMGVSEDMFVSSQKLTLAGGVLPQLKERSIPATAS